MMYVGTRRGMRGHQMHTGDAGILKETGRKRRTDWDSGLEGTALSQESQTFWVARRKENESQIEDFNPNTKPRKGKRGRKEEDVSASFEKKLISPKQYIGGREIGRCRSAYGVKSNKKDE